MKHLFQMRTFILRPRRFRRARHSHAGGRLLAVIVWLACLSCVFAQSQPEKWQRLPLVSQHQRDFFAAKAGDPAYPEAATFLGGEGGQWPQGWAISGDGNVLLWGTDVGGMARTRDGGATWEPANIGFNARGGVAFAIDPKNADRAIAIGGNGTRDFVGAHGIYLVKNLKADLPQWEQKLAVNVVGYRDVREQVAYDPASYDAALGYCQVAYWSRGYLDWNDPVAKHNAIYKTTDGGETWTELHTDRAEYNLGILKVHPTRGAVYLANANGFFKSTDGAATFSKKSTLPVTGLDVIASAGNQDKVFFNTADGVYVSTDAGETFVKVASSNYPPQSGTFMPASFLKVSPADPQRMTLQIQTNSFETSKYYSHNGGSTWAKIQENANNLNYLPFLGGRVGYGLWHPTNPNRAWLFGSDGMQTSFDGAVTSRWSHNGLPAVMGREFNFSTTTPGVFAIPTQDYDVSVTKDNGRTWKYLNLTKNGWGGYVYGAYSSNGNTVFGIERDASNSSRHYVAITRDAGATTTKFADQLISGFHTAFGDPHDATVFFAGEYRSTDEGRTWTRMNGCDGVFIASPTGSRELYGATRAKKIVRSTDRGATWLPIGDVPNDEIKDVAFDHFNNRVYVSTTWNLYQLEVATQTMTDITARIPADQYGNRRFYQVAVDPADPRVVYSAGAANIYSTDVSVRRSVDGGLTWTPLTRAARHNNPQFGLDGAKEAEMVRVNPWTRDLVVGTSCYGTWSFGPPAAPNAGDLPDLVVTDVIWVPAAPKAGDAVTFTATVKNTGTKPTAPGDNLKMRFTVAGTAVYSSDYTAALPVNGTAELTAQWTAVAGSQSVEAVVDAAQGIAEKSEDNNRQGASVAVLSAAAPQVPANLKVVAKSTTTLAVSWEPAGGAVSGYRVYLNGDYVGLTTGTTYNFTGLTRYTEYTVAVASTDNTGNTSALARLTVFTEARGGANLVPKINTPLSVDGALDETVWRLPFTANKSLDGSSDNAVTFGMLWDDDSVYVGVKVLDNDIHTGPADNWQKDGVQLYINGNRSNDTSTEQWYWSQDIIAGKVLGNDSTLYELWSYGDLHMNLGTVKHKTRLISGGYTMEFAIPWGRGNQFRGLGWESGSVGKKLGVDLMNLDNDNGSGRRGILNWSGGWENTWKGQYLGDVTLGGLGGDSLPPSVPTALEGTPKPTKIALSWQSSTDNMRVAEYFIYQDGIRIAEVNATGDSLQTYLAAGLDQNTEYTYQIKAVDEAGNVSGFSTVLAVRTLSDSTAPSTPTGLAATNVNSTNLLLTWTASTDDFGVDKYLVYRDTTLIGTVAAASLQATGLSPLTNYRFRVKAVDEVGNVSAASSPLNLTTPDHRIARAVPAKTPMLTDGQLAEAVWNEALVNAVTQNIEGTTNNQVTFGTAWDATNLYVAVKVLDGSIQANPGQFWSTDALEIYLDANNSRQSTYDADDRQLTRVVFNAGTFGTSGVQSGVTHAWDTIPGGYVLEMSIAWTNLGITPADNMTLGFDLGNNDDDDGNGRDGVLMWNGNGDNYRNASLFGKLTLQPKSQPPVASITAPVADMLFPAGSILPIQATATDPDGTVARVEFYNGTTLLGTDASAPYSFTIANAATGTYNLTAAAYDNDGVKTTSAPVEVKVVQPGIYGTECALPNQEHAFELVIDPSQIRRINWWVNGDAKITPNATDRRKVKVTFSRHNRSQVSLVAGVDFKVAPWYTQFSKTVRIGGCTPAARQSAAAEGSDIPVLAYPNPTKGSVSFDLGRLSSTETTVRIFDGVGREYSLPLIISGPNSLELNLKPLPAGLYLLRLESPGISQTVRVIRQ